MGQENTEYNSFFGDKVYKKMFAIKYLIRNLTYPPATLYIYVLLPQQLDFKSFPPTKWWNDEFLISLSYFILHFGSIP